jgi:hypothetical protein
MPPLPVGFIMSRETLPMAVTGQGSALGDSARDALASGLGKW